MLHHLLFVASQTQIERTKEALARLDAQPVSNNHAAHDAFFLQHPLLDKLSLNIHLVSDLDAITPHLRRHPVDLLIYDERERGIEAQDTVRDVCNVMYQYGFRMADSDMIRLSLLFENVAQAERLAA